MPVRLSSKGQLVIPSEVRKSLGLKPGDRFDVRLENDEIILTPSINPQPWLVCMASTGKANY